jgi:hypothetical protein
VSPEIQTPGDYETDLQRGSSDVSSSWVYIQQEQKVCSSLECAFLATAHALRILYSFVADMNTLLVRRR